MNSDRGLEIRDRLNAIIDELLADSPTQEDHIIACSVAVGVEELEKWLYDGDFTPSVRPNTDKWAGLDVKALQKEQEAKKSVFEREPTLAKLKENGIKVSKPKINVFERGPDDWDIAALSAFRQGNGPQFIRRIQLQYGVNIRDSQRYFSVCKSLNPVLWKIDQHGGDSCPKCKDNNVQQIGLNPTMRQKFAHHPYRCLSCGQVWG